MPLILVPALTDLDVSTIRDHVDFVRSKRLVATMEYHSGRNAKLEHEHAVLNRRLEQKYGMLLKEINQLNVAEDKVDRRLNEIENLKNEAGLVSDQIVIIETPED